MKHSAMIRNRPNTQAGNGADYGYVVSRGGYVGVSPTISTYEFEYATRCLSEDYPQKVEKTNWEDEDDEENIDPYP